MEKKETLRIVILSIIITAIFSLSLGIMIGKNIYSDKKETNDNEKKQTQEEKKNTSENAIAKQIIEKYKIEEFLSLNFYETSQNNLFKSYIYDFIRIQDSTNDYYIHINDEKKYNLDGIQLIEYKEFLRVYKEIFNKEYERPQITTEYNPYVKLTDINLDEIDNKEYNLSHFSQCEINNSNDCYIIVNWNENIATGYFPPKATLKNYTVENNIIKGKVEYRGVGDEYSEATFELEYEKENNRYYLKSLIITS